MVFMSIIVPVYNRKASIIRCLNSILRQSFKNYELIIIDDGSDDGTGEACQFYGKKFSQIKVIHQKNKGVSSARNIGIKEATGEVCLFVDSDDYLRPNYLQQIKLAYDRFGGEFIYVTSYKIFTEHDFKFVQYSKSSRYSILLGSDFLELINKGLFNAVNNKVYQMSVIQKNKIEFPENLNLGEDLIFNLRYLDKQEKFQHIVLNENYYVYCGISKRVSLESKWRKDYFEIQQVLLRQKLRFIKKWIYEGKISPDNIENQMFDLYANFAKEVKNYYIMHLRNMNLLQIIMIIGKIAYSPEYMKYKRIGVRRSKRCRRVL